MKYGISFYQMLGLSPSIADVVLVAQEAESLGFQSLVASDHVLMPNSFVKTAYPAGKFSMGNCWYDPFVMLAAIATATKTIRLGTGITVVSYRPPIQQAQSIATLDFVSGGRFYYGVGVGWMREEFEALGVPFAERGQRTDEYLEVMKQLWSGSGNAFEGKFIDHPGGRISPLPIQQPHPPILVGGETPPALRRIAQYGDGFYMNWKTPSQFRKMLDALAEQMARYSRQISDLYMQLGATDIELLRAQKASIFEYESMGVDEIIYCPKAGSVNEGMEMMKTFANEFF